MTDLPAWARACLDVVGLDLDNNRSNGPQGAENAKLSASPEWKKLGPLTQEKGDPFWGSLQNSAWTIRDATPLAGFTCQGCPQPERYYSYTERVYSKDGVRDVTVHKYTQRCTECSRKMKRWQRGQRDAEMALIGSEMYKQGISFVTLTKREKQGDCLGLVRQFKKDVAEFRKKFPDDVVSGGKDYYEWTLHPDDKAWSNPIVWNVHCHGVWVMDFWKQSEMQDTWGHGIVHIKRAGWRKGSDGRWRQEADEVKDTTWYCTKYAGKADVKGIRLKEGFGCLYGSAKRALLEASQVKHHDES